MRHRAGFVGLVVLGVFGFSVTAAEKPPEDYQKAMQALGAFAKGVGPAITAEDYPAVTKFATSAKDSFTVVEKYWTGKADDAMKMAQAGGKSAADLGVAVGLQSQEGAAFAAKEITDLCMGCHTAHRERMPDGTFQIKW